MPAVLLTGFPGFLGSALAERLLRRYGAGTDIVCLVQPKFMAPAQARARALEAAGGGARVRLLEGDIRLPDLGLKRAGEALQDEVQAVYHLAAVYDLGVSRERALRINVSGTRHMLDFAAACAHRPRFHYMSTCFVSGRHAGVFTEADLEVGQRFNNAYEETKYLAEAEVQARTGLPVTVYRPAMVVGDSRTGATQKYDGLYYVLQWILRQLQVAVMPVVGNPEAVEVNVVPRDFVIDALDYLSARDVEGGQVYQLCDPAPPTAAEVMEIMGEATAHRLLRVRMPQAVVKGALRHVPGVHRLLRIEPEAVDYFTHPTRYRCPHTLAALQGSGIACPPFHAYAARLVDFMRNHPEITPAAMA